MSAENEELIMPAEIINLDQGQIADELRKHFESQGRTVESVSVDSTPHKNVGWFKRTVWLPAARVVLAGE